ncbi:hypothetical protein [Polaribacter sp. Asnod1-A03]|uniref:hypothetical protein n=1 Tax=Polaribacter sp. Asnod1-A03 TaxID=3160581 RepID=UPI00386CC079
MYFWSILGVLFVAFTAVRFFNEIGKSLPVIELMLLIAGLQWIVGAYNSYILSVKDFKYFMRVDEQTYMSYVVPAFLGFAIILLIRTKHYKLTLDFDFSNYVTYGRYLLLIGIFADVLKRFAPPSLLFFLYLISLFKFVGAGVLLFSEKRMDRLFFYGSLVYLLFNSLRSAMFHDLILWGMFLFLIWALKNKPTVKTKLLLIGGGLAFVVVIQMVKASFREAVWKGYNGNKIELFLNTFDGTMSDSYFSDDKNLNRLNVRLNQGWHISSVMDHVPQVQPYADGETVVTAIEGTLLPRFLSQNKKLAGGKENFEKFTGFILGHGTSMGISLVGEGYANYGMFGGIIFMAVWAWFLSWYWVKIVDFCIEHPLLLIFVPLLFLQVVKAETELFVALNHLVKASIVVALFFYISRKYFNWEV